MNDLPKRPIHDVEAELAALGEPPLAPEERPWVAEDGPGRRPSAVAELEALIRAVEPGAEPLSEHERARAWVRIAARLPGERAAPTRRRSGAPALVVALAVAAGVALVLRETTNPRRKASASTEALSREAHAALEALEPGTGPSRAHELAAAQAARLAPGVGT
jgi:hypothetical protein